MNNEYKIIPFADLKIGQQFECADGAYRITDWPFTKVSESKWRCGESSINNFSAIHFRRGCLVRIADCEPETTYSVEGVLKSIVIAMKDIQTNADDTLWINSGETVFERLWYIYTLHGGDEEVLKEAFPLYA